MQQQNRANEGILEGQSTGYVQTAARIKPSNSNLSSVLSASQETGNLLIATRNGVNTQSAAAQFKRDQDLPSFKATFKDNIQSFLFDAVYNSSQTSEKIYSSYMSSATAKVLRGASNASILIYGPSGAGKSFTFNGEEKGVAFKACEELLNSVAQSNQSNNANGSNSRLDTSQSNTGVMPKVARTLTASKLGLSTSMVQQGSLKISVYSIYADQIFDLLQPFTNKNIKASIRSLEEKSLNEVKISELLRQEVRSMQEFKQVISSSISNLLLIGDELKEPNFYGKSHLIIQFEVPLVEGSVQNSASPSPSSALNNNNNNNNNSSKSKQKPTKLSIVRLADTDIYANSQESAKNDFAVLKKYLNHCSRYTETSTTYKLYKQSMLTYTLRSTLNEATHIRLLCCVSATPTSYISSLKTIEFFGRMSTGLDRTVVQNASKILNSNPNNNNTSQKNDQNTSSSLNKSNRNARKPSQNTGTSSDGEEEAQFDSEEIIISSENLIKELSRMPASLLAKMPQKDKNAWTGQKHAQIDRIQGQLDLHNADFTESQTNYLDSLIKNANSMLNRILSHTRQQETDGSNSDEEVEAIKDKIDRQISRLQSSCSPDTRSSGGRGFSGSSAVVPPSTTAFALQQAKRAQFESQQSKLELQQKEQELKESRRRDQQFREDLVAEAEDSLEELREQNAQLQQRIEEYAESERALRYRNEDLQLAIAGKNDLIESLTLDVKRTQEDLDGAVRRVREYEIEADNSVRIENYLRDSQANLTQQLSKKRNKIRDLKSNNHSLQKSMNLDSDRVDLEVHSLQEQLHKAHQTIAQLRGDLQAIESDFTECRRARDSLEFELQSSSRDVDAIADEKRELTQKLQTQFEETIDRTRSLNKFADELDASRRQSAALEDKLMKLREQLESEREQAGAKLHEYRSKRKDELNRLNEYIDDQEKKITALSNEGKLQAVASKALAEEKAAIEEQRDHIQIQLVEAKQTATNAKETLNDNHIELERMQNLVQSLEDRLKHNEVNSLNDARLIQQLRNELEECWNEIQDVREANGALENRILSIEAAQDEEITQIERQVNALVDENNLIKTTNEEQRVKEQGLREQIIALTDSVEAVKEKYYKAKHSNKTLKSEIRELEDRQRHLETQRLLQEKEQEKLKIAQKLSEQKETKLKVIDEIQSLIQSHKKGAQSSISLSSPSSKLYTTTPLSRKW